ncbi:hypothetical protein EPJ66_04825 [Brachyspira aalborgi]|uniref:DUF4136 domain-containing protein n=1 Tax=Brachyspira aalborgi TaxID=29522 RepID=A0A5C8EGR0_9SPIR|nr:CsgG/HfaB family protein [Brachyspira aalborgi]TXJ36648.1 hypothetical protein EPJ81_09895 [Brachyspira aalborgi]TXJ52584.1 hypothetical protein EPJ66_04825 [Brachyspira aalborgi]
MFRKFLIISFIFIANISLMYSKEETITLACLPSEGTMEEKARASYVSAVEGALIKAGYNVADRQRLEKILKEIKLQDSSNNEDITSKAGKVMKVDYLVAVIVDYWEEQGLNNRAMEQDRKNDTMKPKEAYYITFEHIRITLKVIEVETSIIIAQRNIQDFNIKGYVNFFKRDTQNKLAKKVVDKVMKDVKKQIKKKKRN